MDDDEVNDLLHGQCRHREIEPLDPQRGCAEGRADDGRGEPARDHRNLERDAGAREVDGGVGADRDDGAIAEVDLPGAAHQEVEAEGCGRPDHPWQEIADQIEAIDDKRKEQQHDQDSRNQSAIERQPPQLPFAAVGGVTDAGPAVEHQTLSMCSRPSRP